jgi:DNA repair photolyase
MLADLWAKKAEIAEELKKALGERAKKAKRDHHSRRPPRPCGMTIHTGIGCNYGCIYCYVPDMGFPMKPKPYPLEPLEMVYALAINPYVIPQRTLAAYGSVTEPFLKETRKRALEYIKEVWSWLRLPSQVSTKSILDEEIIESLKEGDNNISVLVSVSAIGEVARTLEPNAPPPEERILSAGEAVRKGIKVTLFLRPIIPSITEVQAEEILELAWKAGIREVVLGTLRVTPGILRRLRAAGLENVVSEILRRLPRRPKNERDQVTIRGSDLKKAIERTAKRMGFKVLPSSCSANIEAHGEYCEACDMGPCGDPAKKIKDPEAEARELLEVLGIKYREAHYDGKVLRVYLNEVPKNIKVKILLEVSLRVKVRVLT